MNKKAVWGILVAIVLLLVVLLIYADQFGNPKLQDTVSELFKVAIGAVIGAAANEVAKP